MLRVQMPASSLRDRSKHSRPLTQPRSSCPSAARSAGLGSCKLPTKCEEEWEEAMSAASSAASALHHCRRFLSDPNPNPPRTSHSLPTNRRGFLLSLPASAALLLYSGPSPAASQVYDPVSESERAASAALTRRVEVALGLLDQGREFQARGDFVRALDCFTQVVKDYKEFAFTDYARVGRALALYEIGNREEAIAEMEDISISLKGYPEVHAALAAALYVDKHAPLLAENQFTIATLMDPHYTDLSYVKETKHWPPSLVSSLQQFITLS